MSFFAQSPISSASVDPTSFHPLFRFLDDFENYNQTSTGTKTPHHNHHGRSLRTFNPKFDVKETADNYELYGELPGIEQKDIGIEFTDGQTLVIHGHTERSYAKGTPPAGASIEGNKNSGAITERESGHQPRVEDEDEAQKHEAARSGNGNTKIATRPKEESKQQQPQGRFWVSERSVGEFSRTFSFPSNVDSDAVTASLKDGILSIVVPKAKKASGRKIQITS